MAYNTHTLKSFTTSLAFAFRRAMLHNYCYGVLVSELSFVASIALHYSDVIIGALAYQITSVSTVSSTVCSDVDKKKHQSFASLHGLYEGNSPVTGDFPSQRASNAENVWDEITYPFLNFNGATVEV